MIIQAQGRRDSLIQKVNNSLQQNNNVAHLRKEVNDIAEINAPITTVTTKFSLSICFPGGPSTNMV